MVTEAVIERLVDGVWSKIVVCRVDPVIAVAPRARPTADLYLSRETLLHVLDEHKVPVEDLTLLADAVNRGLVIAERERARFATICYQSEVEGKRYIAPDQGNCGRQRDVRNVVPPIAGWPNQITP